VAASALASTDTVAALSWVQYARNGGEEHARAELSRRKEKKCVSNIVGGEGTISWRQRLRKKEEELGKDIMGVINKTDRRRRRQRRALGSRIVSYRASNAAIISLFNLWQHHYQACCDKKKTPVTRMHLLFAHLLLLAAAFVY